MFFCTYVNIHASFFGAFCQTFVVVVIKHALTDIWGWDWGGAGIQPWRWMGDVTECILVADLKRIWGVELTTHCLKQNGSFHGHRSRTPRGSKAQFKQQQPHKAATWNGGNVSRRTQLGMNYPLGIIPRLVPYAPLLLFKQHPAAGVLFNQVVAIVCGWRRRSIHVRKFKVIAQRYSRVALGWALGDNDNDGRRATLWMPKEASK